MPSSTRPSTPAHSNAPQSSKHAMSDAESVHQDRKKTRRNSSAEPSTRRDSNRDTKRRRRRKKKAPVVSPASKNEATHSRLGEHSRAPLSTRNEINRFGSAPSEADLPASPPPTTKQAPSSNPLDKSRQGSSTASDDTTDHRSQGMPLSDKKRTVSMATPLSGSSSSLLEERIARLEVELKSKNDLIVSHQALLNHVQQAVTCQVCLDLMYKPYALAPCGHLACHSCLVNWFTAPPPDNRPALPATTRKKTCPHCRALVRERPIEVWSVKGIAQAAGKSGLLPNQSSVPVKATENLNANADPWKDIFPKSSTAIHHRFPWFVPDADVDDNDLRIADGAAHGEDVGMLDTEDGGIYRCLDCMHEIWDGVCSSCGRVYPGHRHGVDEDNEGNHMGWLEDQMGAEEVDVADDPGWMGLEDGEADDDGDIDDWRPFAPWRRQFHMFRGPWGFLGTIHVDEEDNDEEDEMYGRVDDLRIADEDEGSGDEGYESSFIDDGDEGDAGLEDGPRIYEIDNDNQDEDDRPTQRSRIVDLDPDEGDEQERFSDVPQRRRGGHRHAAILFSSDEEADESDDEVVPRMRRQIRGPLFGSDSSDIEGY